MSSSAVEKISGAIPIIRYSENTRDGILAMLGNRTSKENYTLEQLRMFKTPDIQKLNEKSCGLPGNPPCVITPCGGALCQNSNGNKQCGGPNCNGTLPLSTNTVKKAEETDMLLNNLTRQLQESENQIESIRKMAEDTKTKGSQLHGKLEKVKNQTEIDRENAKEFIKKVKDFLLDESAPPEDIEKVAKHVLEVNLPRTPQELTNMLDKIRNLVTHCEDYEINVNKINKQRKDAQKLLVEAKQAEEAAKALPPLDEMINNLKEAESTKGQTKDTFIRLNGERQEIKIKISQAENQVNKTSDKLKDISEKQSDLKDEIAMLQRKMLMNGNQAAHAKADAEQAQNQAMDTDKVMYFCHVFKKENRCPSHRFCAIFE
ncbi:laminin subunit beta 4 [Chelydra serpentina]|uniref:Laminin subunit beta 4 n=1 Tax=Chelydra serpentina TaxID=8475 RepID=A0A8T1T5G2_CHESE|nr:laminin subunit beta 4 [Chelydra serpentina]